MSLVLIAVHRASAWLQYEVREACAELGVTLDEWSGGLVAKPVNVVVSGLEAGVRKIPDDLQVLTDSCPGSRLLLCTQEALIKPRVLLADGRVMLLAPPIERSNVSAALSTLLRSERRREHHSTEGGAGRVQLVRRTHWLGWLRGSSGPPLVLHEDGGTAIVVGASATDPELLLGADAAERADTEVSAGAGIFQLGVEAGAWALRWGAKSGHVVLHSPDRLPRTWIPDPVELPSVHNVRIAAFPRDQLILVWSSAAQPPEMADVLDCIRDDATQTFARGSDLIERSPHLTLGVLEVR